MAGMISTVVGSLRDRCSLRKLMYVLGFDKAFYKIVSPIGRPTLANLGNDRRLIEASPLFVLALHN